MQILPGMHWSRELSDFSLIPELFRKSSINTTIAIFFELQVFSCIFCILEPKTLSEMMRILIADDHEIVRQGLKRTLLEEFTFAYIEQAGNAIELIEKSEQDKWDIIISDLAMPGGGGLTALKKIKEKIPELPILILSIYPEEQYALRVMHAGASGYLNKDAAGEELIKAVHRILAGKKYFSDATIEKYRASYTLVKDGLLHESLSERELAVFKLLAAGISIMDISASLSVNTSTVSTYRSRILEKLNIKSNAELTLYAIEFGII
jgi:two-component system invasion response regulator UvrY